MSSPERKDDAAMTESARTMSVQPTTTTPHGNDGGDPRACDERGDPAVFWLDEQQQEYEEDADALVRLRPRIGVWVDEVHRGARRPDGGRVTDHLKAVSAAAAVMAGEYFED